MTQLKVYIRHFIILINDWLPTRLPIGVTEHEAYVASLLADHGLPDNPSYKHAVATAIMHLGPTVDAIPRRYFVKTIRKAMANQIAYESIQRLKAAEEAYHNQLERDCKASAEATLDKATGAPNEQ